MGLLNTDLATVNARKPRNSDRIIPGEELNFRGLLDAATNVPVVGDALSGGLAIYDAAKGDYGSAALNALGVLPFLSAGMIKGTGKVADVLNAKHSALDGFISESPKQITLSKIVVPKELRNQGQGTAFMNDLVSEADKAGKTVALTPSSDFGGSKARLQDFYKRFGFVPNKGKTADYEISEAMYRNPQPDAVNTPKLTEFEQRHLIAQRNAALPVEQGGLGLPPDNTAMDRAAILFPESGYHATGADIKSIDPSKVAASDYGTIGQGFYIDPREGAGYSNLVAKINSNKAPQNIMPLRYNADNLYDVTDLVGVRDSASSAKLTRNLKDAGYSGTVSMTMDGLPNEVAIFDPSKVRSRFAAFDPMRRYEADLLGYADPRLLGAIAGGGLLGLGGYKLMGDK